jgi:glycosyltransferase involved in cell wall biosynthesis
MILGIDASNIREGGGLTHLRKILEYADPELLGITQVIVWGGRGSLEYLPEKPWLDLLEIRSLNQPLHKRLLWQLTELAKLSAKSCDLLFAPGGLYLGSFRPYVTMFQNMQIFETNERNREGLSKEWLRLRFLQSAQSKTFRGASGLICLSEYAHNYLTRYHSDLISGTPVQLIAHGTENFQNDLSMSFKKVSGDPRILRLLYVSTVKKYKHQWNLIDAVGLLRKEGISIELHLIGSGDTQALQRMKEAIQRNDSVPKNVFYHGSLSYKETLAWYHQVDMFVFPSTCETFGISLLEAMTAGLPIASSNRGPMPEVLKDAGLYFDPESVTSIKNCLRYMIANPDLQQHLGAKAKQYSQKYSWGKCAHETFSFLRTVYEENKI